MDVFGKHLPVRLLLLILFVSGSVAAQPSVSKVWVADNRDGTYRNPILHADYSDPDVIRVGDDFYLVASSFNAAPGLPILHSRDLVNWTIAGHALPRQPPFDVFSKPQHGNGVWAPAIRRKAPRQHFLASCKSRRECAVSFFALAATGRRMFPWANHSRRVRAGGSGRRLAFSQPERGLCRKWVTLIATGSGLNSLGRKILFRAE